jgi:hypothetical protein
MSQFINILLVQWFCPQAALPPPGQMNRKIPKLKSCRAFGFDKDQGNELISNTLRIHGKDLGYRGSRPESAK